MWAKPKKKFLLQFNKKKIARGREEMIGPRILLLFGNNYNVGRGREKKGERGRGGGVCFYFFFFFLF